MEAAYKTYLDKLAAADVAAVIPGPEVVHLSPRRFSRPSLEITKQVEPAGPAGRVRTQEITTDQQGLQANFGEEKFQLLPMSATEFFVEAMPDIRVSFTKK